MENITREKLKITFINIKNNVKISRKLVSRFLEGGKKIEILSHFFRLFFREFYTRGHVEGPRKDERRIAPYNE